MYTWLIDNGHGGMINGEYTTAPAKMYDHGDFVFYEGVYNRIIAKMVCDMCASEGINHKLLVPEEEDISLVERVRRVNELCLNPDIKPIFLSIHANAGGGVGHEIFTSKGTTKSDRVAEYFLEAFGRVIPKQRQRVDLTDGDRDKEAQFYVLRKTKCPAILTECGFMDNYDEAKWLLTEEGLHDMAAAHFEGIKLCNKLFK